MLIKKIFKNKKDNQHEKAIVKKAIVKEDIVNKYSKNEELCRRHHYYKYDHFLDLKKYKKIDQ